MRQSEFLMKLSRLLVFLTITALLSACAATPATSPEGSANAETAAQKAAMAGETQKAEPLLHEVPSFPSSALPYKLMLPKQVATWDKKIIYANEVWSGDILVTQPVTITKTGTLTIAEGATIYFDVTNRDGDKKTPWLTVRGKLFIRGTAEKLVRMTSVFLRHHDNQDIVNAVEAKEVAVDYTLFERGGWGMHIHDTPTEVRFSTFKDNYGGARFKSNKISFTRCSFEGNRIGTRLLNSTGANFIGNIFAGNLTGIFFREGVKTPVIKNNDFDNYEYDIKLGENQTINIEVGTNWWKNASRADLEDFIYDGKDSEGVGTVYTAPPADKPFTLE